MKTLSQYTKTKVLYTKEEQIDEGLFGKLIGSIFKKNANLLSSIGSALGEEKGNRLKKFEEEFFKKGEKSAEQAVKGDDPKKAIKYIEDSVEELKKSGVVKEEDEWTFKAIQAFMMNSQHTGDEEYKKVMQEYIDKCKTKGGSDTKKELENVGKKVNGKVTNPEEENTNGAPTEQDKANDSKSSDKAAKALGGDSTKVKQALDPIIKMESLQLEDDELLEAKITVKDLENNNKTIYDFRQKYLYGKKLKAEEKAINRKVVIDFVAALSAIKENIKGASSAEIKEFVTQLLQYENLNKSIFS